MVWFVLTSISGRSVIVTGASKGIGKGIARVFASKGAHVLLVARNLDLVEAAACEIRSIGGIAHAVAADVSCMEDTVQMAKVAVECYGGIDILCCNAGVFPSAKLGEMRLTGSRHTRKREPPYCTCRGERTSRDRDSPAGLST